LAQFSQRETANEERAKKGTMMTGERRTVTFRVIGKAEPKGSTKAFLGRGSRFPIVTSDNPRLRGWEHLVRAQAQGVAEQGGLFLGPVLIAMVFHLPRPLSLPKLARHHRTRPDLDKLVRAVVDALIGVLYADDAAIIEIRARKCYAEPDVAPWVCITVAEAPAPVPRQSSLQLLLLEDSPYAVQ
jgi:crossover junction endodeoxyribonuclease RusA